MLLSETKRDEYVTHLALDLGYNNEEIRKAVIDAGFAPLPAEPSAEEKHAKCGQQMKDGLDTIKAGLNKLFWKQVTFTDFESDGPCRLMGFTFTTRDGTEFTCWANAFGDTVEDYMLMPTKDIGMPGIVAMTAKDYEPETLVTQFRKKYMTVA